MARTKATARKSVASGSKSKKLSASTARKSAGTVEGIKAKRRYHPGTVALREIKRY